jgi:hypothetical protein
MLSRVGLWVFNGAGSDHRSVSPSPFWYTGENVVRVRSEESLRIRFITHRIRLQQTGACAGL